MGSDLHARRLLVFLVLAAVVLVAMVLEPFWVALFLAAVLAAAFRSWMEWLARKLRGHRGPAAVLLTVGLLLAVLIPLGGLGAVLVREALGGIEWLRAALASEGVGGLVQRLPGPFEALARRLVAALPDAQGQLARLAGEQGGTAAAAVGGALAATGTVLFQTAMMLIAFYFFLVDGRSLVDWIDRQVPLRPGQFRRLLDDFRRTSVSVLVATVATAGIQTVTALLGYFVARAPNPIFLALVTFVVALIPAIGGTAVIVAVALLQLATGHVLSGVFLAVWGLGVVSLIDNFARPYLMRGGTELNGGVIFFALLGGLAVFGGIGLLVGPLVVTFLVTVLQLYRREFGLPSARGAAEGAAAETAAGGDGPEAPPPA